MKKLLVVIALMFTLSAIAYAEISTSAVSSGILSSSAVVVARPARLTDLAVFTNGTNAVTVILYDNATAASGTVIGKIIVPGSAYSGGLVIPVPVKAASGIYCSISGTGGSAIVFYDPQ